MSNIWEVLLQSCTVTLCAALLVIIKNALRDKLSPRWQYGIWAVLALRILAPARMDYVQLFNFPLWFEMLKASLEKGGSAYADKYVPLDVKHGLPYVESAPQSFADWLFIIYIIGIFVFLLRRIWAYARLRALLRKGKEPTEEQREAMERVCGKYSLRPCRMVRVEALPSAFVCGVLRPVLAVPADKTPDDKVLLHELMHLKHRDVLQNVLWCCMHSLHWWNILLWGVFDRIENELESLCDQRVLEMLEGEERREYGGILLDMASEKYARAPGTSSISNGGGYISERIENIARFKKYPRGMALVSLCIAFALILSLPFGGSRANYNGTPLRLSAYSVNNRDRIERSMAVTRLARCQTPDAAIDTYAKAMLQRNGFYLATASPLEEQETIAEELYDSIEEYNAAVNIDVGPELMYAEYTGNIGYLLSSWEEQPDGSVLANLQFNVSTLLDSDGNAIVREYEVDGVQLYEYRGMVMMSIRAEEREDGWVAYECAPREHYLESELVSINMMRMKPGFEKTVVTPHGSVKLHGIVTGSMTEFSSFPIFIRYDNAIHLESEYKKTLIIKAEYDPWERSGNFDRDNISAEDWPGADVSMELQAIWKENGGPDFMYDTAMSTHGEGSRGKSQENVYSYTSWGVSFDEVHSAYPEPYEIALEDAPWGYAVRICWDDEIVEELVIPLEEVLGDG